ncbi:1155_t:CDS:2 [Dentiscutata erythropus]|uniref:1155_t:CDS:1 n=1 Tax=Dentiscutata erythropus TaxID=1348616 RepID=A0A9N8ZGM2_9GLOM|nr:1155_t:CDS:2 [Dentiscutata erythropus]
MELRVYIILLIIIIINYSTNSTAFAVRKRLDMKTTSAVSDIGKSFIDVEPSNKWCSPTNC